MALLPFRLAVFRERKKRNWFLKLAGVNEFDA